MARRDLPPNTYCRRGYYTWRDPRTREEHGLGTNKLHAINEAIRANLHIAKAAPPKPSLIDRLTGDVDRSVAAWGKKYGEYLDKRDLADNTRRSYASHNRRLIRMLGDATAVKSVTALRMSEILEIVAVTEGKARLAQAFRHFAKDWFREAIVAGWIDDNPVRDTKLAIAVEVKRSRLSLETFMAIYERETLSWAKNAYALALVSAQRREDVVSAKFADFRKEAWWLVQASEKARYAHRIIIPMDLRLDVFGMSLGDVVSQCRRTGVLSRFLIHQTQSRGNSPAGSPIFIDRVSKRFSETLSMLGLEFGEKDPPTFHEIRSLSERLYAAQGGVATQHLLGHNDAETTALYHDSRGSEWTNALDGRRIVSE